MNMDNAFFGDIIGFSFSTSFEKFFDQDRTGYFVTLKIDRNDVPIFMEHDIIPTHAGDGRFILQVHLSNVTNIRINGLKLINLSDERLLKIPATYVELEKIVLKRYSVKTYGKAQCYATKMLVNLKKEEF